MRYAAQSGEAKLSKSNGSLMRSSPIGIYCHKLPIEQVAHIAGLICGLSHPNPTVIYAVQSYCIAIARLVDGVKPLEAFNITKEWLKTKAQDPGAQEVLQWLNEAEEFANDAAIGKRELGVLEHLHVPYHPGSGFVRVGYYHAFKHLLMGTPIYGAIAEVLSGGGDTGKFDVKRYYILMPRDKCMHPFVSVTDVVTNTDTNACIVGGLIGAAFGTENIPEALKNVSYFCNRISSKLIYIFFSLFCGATLLVDRNIVLISCTRSTYPILLTSCWLSFLTRWKRRLTKTFAVFQRLILPKLLPNKYKGDLSYLRYAYNP
jgi:ADP-ribosyl-[dinitrogen reductase] hydrolase